MEPMGPMDLPPPTRVSSSPDKAVIPSSTSLLDDHGQYQDFLRCMVTTLKLPADVTKLQDEFLNILQLAGSSRIVLPIHKAILQPVETIWHTPASCAPTPKCAECRYLVLTKNTDFLTVVQAAMQRTRQQHPRVTPPPPQTGMQKS